jgi:hypothetical protein
MLFGEFGQAYEAFDGVPPDRVFYTGPQRLDRARAS